MDLIIGAGISGLSYAYFCGHEDYMVIDRDVSIGGYCKTTKRNGFVWDYSGHFFHFQNQELEKLLTSDMSDRDFVEVIKQTFIKYKGCLIDYPFQKNIHQLPKEEFIDCLYDLFNNEHREYHNFKEMLYVKFGKSIADKFLIPYNSKLYACDLNSLDKEAMGRFFPYAQKNEIIKNFKGIDNSSYNSSFVYPIGGAIEYVNAIYNRLSKNKVVLGKEVVSINRMDKTLILTNGQTVHYDRLISTIPFPKLLELTSIEYPHQVYSWNQVLVFNLGFNKKGKDTRSHWLYFPESEYCFYRVGFYDNILGQDRMSLYVELGFNKNAVINPNSWLGRVLSDLYKAEIVDETQFLVDYESVIMNPAYVHINEYVLNDVKEKKDTLRKSDIYSIGRYGSWTYCSIEDNMLEAKSIANMLN